MTKYFCWQIIPSIDDSVTKEMSSTGLSHPFLGMGPGPLDLEKLSAF